MSRRLVMGITLAALIAAAFGIRALVTGRVASAKEAPQAPTVRVVLAPVEKKDVPVWLDGLGTVAAGQQVTVRAQVDGRPDSGAFREGQAGKKGDAIAQIDPRPFLVQLHQAEGNLARDQATVQNGKKNLERYKELVAGKLIAAQQVDDQAATVAQAEGALRADQAAVEAARLN